MVSVQRFKKPPIEVGVLDEFEHHLRVVAGEHGHSIAVETRSGDGFAIRDCHRLQSDGDSIDTELWIERSNDPAWSLAYAHDANGDWKMWREIVDQAAARVGSSDQAVTWECLFGTRFDALPFNVNTYVAESFVLGDITVGCAESVMAEVVYEPLPGGVGLRSRVRSFWPVRLSGVVHTYDWIWDAGEAQAAELAHEVAAFVAWLWRLPLRNVRGPGRPGVTFVGDPSLAIAPQYLGDAKSHPLDAPVWSRDAFEAAIGSERLRAAFAMHCEGLNLEHDHPSWAATAYVAAVESLSADATSAEGEIRQRYLDAARRLGSDDAGVRLARRVYDNVRSTTVHRATLHGDETRGRVDGWPKTWSPQGSGSFEFSYGYLAFARLLSEVALLNEFGDHELPERWRF